MYMMFRPIILTFIHNPPTRAIQLLKYTIRTKPFTVQKMHKSHLSKSIYLLDEIENDSVCQSNSNKFTYRTYNCNELRQKHIGERVTLCGWLEFQRMNKFLVIRDGYGRTQLLIKDSDLETQALVKLLPYESIIKATGTVLSRPKDMINRNQTTGEVEVLIESFHILNRAYDKLPFNVRDFQKAKEALRMKYRYIDLRFEEMQRNMKVRSNLIMAMRTYLIKECFVDVETPTLFKATPGGAQEFVVPTRFPGEFYSLVQSPQQFKQMLMAGAIDRYFQIARCYRDEGSRSDRQPEFTQLDIEMSFTDSFGVMNLVEELLHHSWPNFLNPLPLSFPKITYKQVMEKYGTDKPDLRFDFTLKNCTEVLKKSDKLVMTENFGAYYLLFEQPLVHLSYSIREKLLNIAQSYPQTKFIQSKITKVNEWMAKMHNIFGEQVCSNMQELIKIPNNSVFFLSYGNKEQVLPLLGVVRLEYVKYLESVGHKVISEGDHPLWVTDIPLFEKGEEPNSLKSLHHPFTAPHPEDVYLLKSEPLKVRSLSYDLVLNGNEIAGGSIRIHNPDQQEHIFDLLHINKSLMQHILDMLASGCPPHGGIAIGLDRLLATILNTQSIRDVIAFPKTFEGRDPISGAPSAITKHDKELYNIEVVNNNSV